QGLPLTRAGELGLAVADIDGRSGDHSSTDPGPEVGNFTVEQEGQARRKGQAHIVEGHNGTGIDQGVGPGEGNMRQSPGEANKGANGEHPPAGPLPYEESRDEGKRRKQKV